MTNVKGIVEAVSVKDKGKYGIKLDSGEWYNGFGTAPQKGLAVDLDFEKSADGKWNNISKWRTTLVPGAGSPFEETHPTVSKEMHDVMTSEQVYEECFDFILDLLRRKNIVGDGIFTQKELENVAAMTATLFIQKMRAR